MIRRVLCFVLLICCCWNAMAAAPVWSWASGADVSAQGAGASATAVATDPSGNIYVAGTYSKSVKFGATTLVPPNLNYNDVYVAKYNATGTLQWVLAAGGSACNAGGLVASASTVYFVGDCTFGAAFGGKTVAAHPTYGNTLFLATIEPGGSFRQVLASGGTGSMKGHAVTLDPEGNLLIAGTFDRSVSLLAAVLTNTGNNSYGDAFVMKLNAAASQVQWMRSGGSSETDNGYAVATDASGNVLLAGDFGADVATANATFGTTTLTIPAFRSGDGFVAKLDKNGNWLWAKSIGGYAFDDARAVGADAAGNVYVAGRFSVSGSFGGITLQAVSLNSYYAYVTKLDASGVFQWAQQAGSSENLIGSHAASLALTVNAAGNPVVGGHFSGNAAFGPTAIASYNKADIFVAELNPASGAFLAVTRAGGGSGNDMAYALALATGGGTIVAGTFEDSASFGAASLRTERPAEFFISAPFVAALSAYTQPPSATAVSSGQLTARNISLQNIQIPAAALANGVSLFVAANIQGTIYCRTSAGWSTQLAPYMSGITQVPSSITIVNNTNLSNHIGTNILIGYGNGVGEAALNDMLQGKKYAVVHTVAP